MKRMDMRACVLYLYGSVGFLTKKYICKNIHGKLEILNLKKII